MQDQFSELRRTIYTTSRGLQRFRELVVNSVMATDIADPELKELRNVRWAKAFSSSPPTPVSRASSSSAGGMAPPTTALASANSASRDTPRDRRNRKATIVIEHVIQASDVAHTMQHWHIYRKWNEKFFIECYRAYREGRSANNPIDKWYDGELGFFDFYIIPLARKLKDCGVFGVFSEEYLNYALTNRKEWESRGREVVDEMVELVNRMDWPSPMPEAADRSHDGAEPCRYNHEGQDGVAVPPYVATLARATTSGGLSV